MILEIWDKWQTGPNVKVCATKLIQRQQQSWNGGIHYQWWGLSETSIPINSTNVALEQRKKQHFGLDPPHSHSMRLNAQIVGQAFYTARTWTCQSLTAAPTAGAKTIHGFKLQECFHIKQNTIQGVKKHIKTLWNILFFHEAKQMRTYLHFFSSCMWMFESPLQSHSKTSKPRPFPVTSNALFILPLLVPNMVTVSQRKAARLTHLDISSETSHKWKRTKCCLRI